MPDRRKTKQVKIGDVILGNRHPIVVQSMTKTATTDIAATLRQIKELAEAGADLVRIAVPTAADTAAFAKLVQKSPVPLIADIHFSPQRAIEAIEAGAAKIRLNPGNIKNRSDIFRIIDAAKSHRIAVRIGINEASIRDLKHDTVVEKRISLMIREMAGYVKLFESRGLNSIVLSVKSADVERTILANRAIAEKFHYPIHLGLTHAGLPQDAAVPSAVAIGSLLSEGIGDTVRVSLAGEPLEEVRMGIEILKSLGLRQKNSPTLTVCPTCGRCRCNVVKLAEQIREKIKDLKKPLHIAVMGCIVNGPGEAADADAAVCAAKGKGYIYRKGKKIAVVNESKIVPALIKVIMDITD